MPKALKGQRILWLDGAPLLSKGQTPRRRDFVVVMMTSTKEQGKRPCLSPGLAPPAFVLIEDSGIENVGQPENEYTLFVARTGRSTYA